MQCALIALIALVLVWIEEGKEGGRKEEDEPCDQGRGYLLVVRGCSSLLEG